MMQAPEPSQTGSPRKTPELMLVGASVRAAAESAAKSGFSVVGVDLFGDSDTLDACTHHYFLNEDAIRQLATEPWGTSIPAMLVGGLNDMSLEIARNLPNRWLGTGLDEIDFFSDPSWLSSLADQAGVHFPETADFGHKISGKWLIKSRRSCGGMGIVHADQPTAVSDEKYLQRWIPGRVYGASFYAEEHNCKLLGICRGHFTRIGTRPFVYAGSSGPCRLATSIVRSIMRLGESATRASGLKGFFNVDFLVQGSGVWLLEVNPRWTASMEVIDRASGNSLMGLVENKDLSIELTAERKYYKRVVFAEKKQIAVDPAALKTHAAKHVHIADLPQKPLRAFKGEPIATAVVTLGEMRWRDIRRTLQQLACSASK